MIRRLILLAILFPLLAPAQGNRLIVVLMGPPGAGKTTHAKALKKELKIPIISGEEVIRDSRDRRRGELKQLKGTPLEYGEGLDDAIIVPLIRQRVQKGDATNGFILDGFPQSASQADALKEMASELGIPATVVILLKADDATIRQRMSARGKNFDTPEVIDSRIKAYHEQEAGVLSRIDKSKLVEIDGTMPEKQTTAAILEAVRKFR